MFFHDVHEESLLLLDSWSDQGPSAAVNSPEVSIEYILKGATGDIQPLDKVFFRLYKLIVNDVVQHCRDFHSDENSAVKPSNRFILVKIHSVVYNQVSHPHFSGMWKCGWQEPGYQIDNPVVGPSRTR